MIYFCVKHLYLISLIEIKNYRIIFGSHTSSLVPISPLYEKPMSYGFEKRVTKKFSSTKRQNMRLELL